MFACLDKRFDVFGGVLQNVVIKKDMVLLEDQDDGRAAEGEVTFFFAAQEDRPIVSLGDGGDGKSTDFDEECLSEIGQIKQGDFAVICREDVEILVEGKWIDGVVSAFHWP